MRGTRPQGCYQRILAWLAVLALLVLMPSVEPLGATTVICTGDGSGRVAPDPFAPAGTPADTIHCQFCVSGRVLPILPVLPTVPVATTVFAIDLPLPADTTLPAQPAPTPSCRGPPQET